MKKQNKIINVLIISAIVLAIAVLVVAKTNEELEVEQAQLELDLSNLGYDWLINQQDLNTLKEVYTYPKRGIR